MNRIKKEVYPLFKEQIEKYVGIKVLGFIEEDRNLKIESKYLGLVDPVEVIIPLKMESKIVLTA